MSVMGKRSPIVLIVFTVFFLMTFIWKYIEVENPLLNDSVTFKYGYSVYDYLKPPEHPRTLTTNKKVQPLSQVGQDTMVYNISRMKSGFFIEMGAFDGKTLSNSFWLEQQHNWTGLLIEANPDLCKAIDLRNRNVWRLCACISARNTELYVKGGTLGGNKDTLNPSIFSRYTNKNTIMVPSFDLDVVLSIVGKKDIDYFSLDVEGAELNVLESLKDSLVHNVVSVSIWTIEFRIYDGKRNVDTESKIKLNKIRHFFDMIGGYFEYSILPENQNDYRGLDVVFVSKRFWCKNHSYLPDTTKCLTF